MLQPPRLDPPCADRRGQLPESCPGWCEFSSPDVEALAYDGPEHPYEPAEGTRLPGPITVLRRVGAGGMGTVFEGWHEARREAVAVKFLAPRFVRDPSVRGRFLTEARALSRLDSEHVVPIRQFGQLHGVPYLVMDFVAGLDLGRRLQQEFDPARGARPLPLHEALAVLEGVARGLAAVHGAGIVHNDVKPGNVILGFEGRVTLVDFGLARPFASACRLEPGKYSGTAVYLAPELIGGWVDAPNPAADLYALGILAFELLTGRVPFDHDDTDHVLDMHLHHAPPALSDWVPFIPDELDALVAWCLVKEPFQRIPSAGTFARRIAAIRSSRRCTTPRPWSAR